MVDEERLGDSFEDEDLDTSEGEPSEMPRAPRGRGGGRRFRRAKICSFCVDRVTHIDYKNVDTLRRYVSDRGKILARRQSGACAKHQRALARAIKRARHVALLPFTSQHIQGS